MKFGGIASGIISSAGRSRKGAWIEIDKLNEIWGNGHCRSRKGAWIEMLLLIVIMAVSLVAPVRERGLKCVVHQVTPNGVLSLP